MIKTLRKKFILVMMLSLLIVMALLVGAINIVYAVNIRRQADSTIDVLYENAGSFPEMGPGKEQHMSGEEDGGRNMKGGGMGITPDTKFETSFFIVQLNADKTVFLH